MFLQSLPKLFAAGLILSLAVVGPVATGMAENSSILRLGVEETDVVRTEGSPLGNGTGFGSLGHEGMGWSSAPVVFAYKPPAYEPIGSRPVPAAATGTNNGLGRCAPPEQSTPYPVIPASATVAPRNQGTDWALRARVVALEKKYEELKAETVKKKSEPVTVRIGGRLEVDWATFTQDATSIAVYGNVQDGCQIRRARLSVAGDVYEVGRYQVEYEFADTADTDIAPLGTLQSTGFKTCYIGVEDLPLLNRVRVGFMKEPIGLQWETSSRFIPFMERSLATSALIPERNLGIKFTNWSADERITWAFGVFRPQTPDQPPIRQFDHAGTAFTARFTGLPWYNRASGGRGLFHVGLGYTVRSSDDHTLDVDVQQETRFGPNVVNTGDIRSVEYIQVLGPEAAFVYGPLAIQSEFYHMDVNRGDRASLGFNGYYAEVTYFLTGEQRRYDPRTAKFKEVVPFENFFRVRTQCGGIQTGKGAWEIAYRHSYLDLTSGPILGGRASSHAIGLNWYWNPNIRCMFDYIMAKSTPGSGNPASEASVFQVRAALWF